MPFTCVLGFTSCAVASGLSLFPAGFAISGKVVDQSKGYKHLVLLMGLYYKLKGCSKNN